MKKLLLVVVVMFLCGCGSDVNNDYASYKLYELKSSDIVSYTYNMGYNNNVTYALADISEGEGFTTGLFYQVDENDYILLEEIESCGDENAHESSLYNVFNNDKLYTVRCLGASINEYTLNGTEVQKKELKFDESKVLETLEKDESPHYLESHKIDRVDVDYIYFEAVIHNGPSNVKVKCSFKDNKCELND